MAWTTLVKAWLFFQVFRQVPSLLYEEASRFSNYAIHSRVFLAHLTLCICVVCSPSSTSCLEHVQESLVCRLSLSQTKASPRGKTAIRLSLQRQTTRGTTRGSGREAAGKGRVRKVMGEGDDLGQKVMQMSGDAAVETTASHANWKLS